jgi:hypothetical protein
VQIISAENAVLAGQPDRVLALAERSRAPGWLAQQRYARRAAPGRPAFTQGQGQRQGKRKKAPIAGGLGNAGRYSNQGTPNCH